MSAAVEKLAEVIRATNQNTVGLTFSELTRQMVRDLLLALREPDEEAADVAGSVISFDTGYIETCLTPDDAKLVIQAYIDHLLAD